jgi:hypothetical protein
LCISTRDQDPEPVRSFGTFTGDLDRLADWFEQCGVRTVAMESTGVYWSPAFEILDQRGFEVILVNARDAKHGPSGRFAAVCFAVGSPEAMAQDRCPVLQHPASRHGIQRPRSLPLRGALPPPGSRQPRAACQVTRIRPAGGSHASVAERHLKAAVIVPPRATAVPSDTAETAPTQRDRHLQQIAEHGRLAKGIRLPTRARAEAAIGRFKQVIGDGLRSRTDNRRATEVDVAVHALNRMSELGRPDYVRTA